MSLFECKGMIELPEAIALSKQLAEKITGRIITSAIRGQNPHKFMFPMDPTQIGYYSNAEFSKIVLGKSIGKSFSEGNVILTELHPGYLLSLGCGGETILYHFDPKTIPKKHQLLLEFDDSTFLSVTISGWGEVRLLESSQLPKHPHIGFDRMDPLSNAFTLKVFQNLIQHLPLKKKCSAKKFFISEPGLRGIGNGVIQDIFFLAGVHPRREMSSLTKEEQSRLFETTKQELQKMAELKGRDCEKTLFNDFGGYKRILYSNVVDTPCPVCKSPIKKEQFLGGSVYFCASCQPLP